MRIVVAGAGSAGCAAAGRLAERGHEVALLDAGPGWRSEACDDEVRHPRDDIFAWRVDGRSPSRFAFPGVSARRFEDSAAEPYLRGWGMGGTSALNGLVAIRPPVDEFVHWEELGCTGWGWGDVLPVFRRLENDVDYGSTEYHGRGGPVPIVRRAESEWGSGDRLLADAATTAGHAWEPDYHRPGALGVSRTASHIRFGVRVTSYDGYVDPWRSEGRISVYSGVAVSRVLFDGDRAMGVEAIGPDDEIVVFEGDEIVVAAGAASTPGILQRSGIGPERLLEQFRIPLVADLATGQGVKDHVGFWLQVDTLHAQPAANGARGNVTLRYSSGLEHSRPGDLLIVAANPATVDAGETAFGVKLARCMSRGTSRIASADPRMPADIRMNLLSDTRDRELARHALRSSVCLLAGHGAVRDRNGDALDASINDASADKWLRHCARDTSHLTGGARMGTDPEAVVDPNLRIRGLRGVSVADLSVCPTVPRANTYLTAVMIGERVADFLAPTTPRS